ncbi:hypothetical protein [Rickettsia endosymbiont of Orchestes rusci]
MFYVILVQTGIQKNYSHPEFISGSFNRCGKLVQHDKEKSGFPFSRE